MRDKGVNAAGQSEGGQERGQRLARWPGSSERAGRRRSALSKQRAARSHPQGLRSAGGHRASQGCEPSALGPQTLTRTYLLVAVVGDLLLDAVRELGAGILRIFPCSCAWKLSPEEKGDSLHRWLPDSS